MATGSPVLKGKTSPTGSKETTVFFLSKRDWGRTTEPAGPGSQEATLVSKWASKKPAESSIFCLNTFLHLSQVVSTLNNKATKSS